MIETLLSEPMMALVKEWPFIAVLVGILYFMRRDLLRLLDDLKNCQEKQAAIIDRLLNHFDQDQADLK